MNILYDTCIVR